MAHIIFWINVLALAILLAGAGTEFLAWLRRKETWRSIYLATILMYWLFLASQTINYFNHLYLSAPVAWLDPASGWLRSLVSVFLIGCISFYLAEIARIPRRPRNAILLAMPALLTGLGIAYSVAGAPGWFLVMLNILFNAAIAVSSGLGILALNTGKSQAPRGEVLPFLVMSTVVYAIFVILAFLIILNIEALLSPLLPSLLIGFFCVAWGGLLIALAIRRSLPPSPQDTFADPRLVADYALSPRESEILPLLIAGQSSREIGQRCFISARTVESHIYNVYRKCGVKNRMELVALVRNYEAP